MIGGENLGCQVLADHSLGGLGKDTIEEAVAIAKQVTLEGVVDKITRSLLVNHGEKDRPILFWQAKKTIRPCTKDHGGQAALAKERR